MNKLEHDILKYILYNSYTNQRNISNAFDCSLGSVNKSIKNLINNKFLDEQMVVTEKTYNELSISSPKNAIILAAGYGMRMVPINTETPKGLLVIKSEVLIERIIRQLYEVGITEIYIVVGFMKEQYEYLIDEYGVNLIVNNEYSSKNNLHSLFLASNYISNTYIIPCDIWCENNPFSMHELYSWYMITEANSINSYVKCNRKKELIRINNINTGNKMIGIAYLTGDCSYYVKSQLAIFDKRTEYTNSFWEETLFFNNKMVTWAKIEDASKVFEIDTYEQLREIDENSNSLNTEALSIISNVFNVNKNQIVNITVLKKGMTNRSFTFQINEKKYIMRIPGEGTDKLINRKNEFNIYNEINHKNICENIIYMNPDNGYKITEFINDTRTCNPNMDSDLIICMSKLRDFHNMNLKVNHTFDLYKQIEFYESLWENNKSIYRDYLKTKNNIYKLKKYIDEHKEKEVLTHIDAVPDNFLISGEENNKTIYLIDWEYAAMQDPHIDIAMFCIYSLYNKEQIDKLIDIYFENSCSSIIRAKIYCYISVCGLLWSNWCEYKQQLGVEFGEYSIKQYRYAKDYFKIAVSEISKLGEII